VEEPSTASKADVGGAIRDVRFGTKADIAVIQFEIPVIRQFLRFGLSPLRFSEPTCRIWITTIHGTAGPVLELISRSRRSSDLDDERINHGKIGWTQMLRILFAVGIAGLVFAGGSGTTQAAPILPLPAAATAGIDNMTDVQWGPRCWRDRWGRLRCPGGWGGGWGPGWGAWGAAPGWGGGWGRNCWRDGWGRLHCRW